MATLKKKKKSLLKNSVKIPTGTARILIQWSPFRFNADRIFHAKRVEPIEFRFRVAVVFLLFFFCFFLFHTKCGALIVGSTRSTFWWTTSFSASLGGHFIADRHCLNIESRFDRDRVGPFWL